ncbi:MAG: hypothetical protein HDS72_04440 [Bacteroidales bacterium]|nr:hypothetical protein [Bacteroidales bacterium]
MNYNELYERAGLIAAVNNLPLPAKAKAEALILRAVCAPAIDTFEKERAAIKADDKATEEQKKEAVEARAKEECAAPDRRFTPEAFEQIVGAAMAAGTVPGFDNNVSAEAFLEILAFKLVNLD